MTFISPPKLQSGLPMVTILMMYSNIFRPPELEGVDHDKDTLLCVEV